MVKINLKDFKPVQVRANGLVLTSGGHLRKEYPLHTKDVKLEGSLSVAFMGKWRVPGLMCQGVLKDLITG